MYLLQLIVLLGGPGLLLGAGLGALLPRWKLLIALALVGAIACWYGIEHVPDDPDEDDDPAILIFLAIVANYAGWLVGLALGAVAARAHRRRLKADAGRG